MKSVSDALTEGRVNKPDPDHWDAWRDNMCTKYLMQSLQIDHQIMLENLGSLDTGDAVEDSKYFHKLRGGVENCEAILGKIKGDEGYEL